MVDRSRTDHRGLVLSESLLRRNPQVLSVSNPLPKTRRRNCLFHLAAVDVKSALLQEQSDVREFAKRLFRGYPIAVCKNICRELI